MLSKWFLIGSALLLCSTTALADQRVQGPPSYGNNPSEARCPPGQWVVSGGAARALYSRRDYHFDHDRRGFGGPMESRPTRDNRGWRVVSGRRDAFYPYAICRFRRW